MKLIKIFARFFATPLTHIFNESFRCNVFPEIWKISNVCGIPKVQPCASVEDLRPISLTSVLSKVQESYAFEWIREDIQDRISESQFGGIPGSSALLALVYLLHKWHMAMNNTGKIIRISFLDFRKAFDLIDHNKLLENFTHIGVRPELIGWLGSYLQGRSQITTFRGEQSDQMKINGGVPQGSKLGPTAFIIKVNNLPTVSSYNEDTIMFLDDTTLSEVIDVSNHLSGTSVGNMQRNVNNVIEFATNERMELNNKKCKEMLIDYRKNKTDLPPICLGEHPMLRVKSYKLLGVWIDDDLKWNTNTEQITKKAAKRLYLLKVLKSYGAPKKDLLTFYCVVIRSTLEYGAQVWHGGLTQAQNNDIERIQKRALRIIDPLKDYEQALTEAKMKSLKERRDEMSIVLVKNMRQPIHKLHNLLPMKSKDIKERETRTSGQKIYNFFCRTERFKHSPLVYAIDLYNSKLN